MDTTTSRASRPFAVNLAVIILLVVPGSSIIRELLRANWGTYLVFVKYGSELAMMVIPLWFIFRGKNWARWLYLAFLIGSLCLSLPLLSRNLQAHSASWIARFCCLSALEVGAVAGLFLPASNRWFRQDRSGVIVRSSV